MPTRNRERFPRSRQITTSGGRIPPREPYPQSVNECLEDDRTYKPDVLRAVRDFRRAKAWRGTIEQRKDKFSQLHQELCEAYGLTTRLAVSNGGENSSSGNSFYMPETNKICLSGRLSVVTYLHEFAHALGYGEQGACRWSLTLFRRMFPNSFARLTQQGHMLVRNNERN